MDEIKDMLQCVSNGDLEAAKAKVNAIMDARLAKLLAEGESFLAAGLTGVECAQAADPVDEPDDAGLF